MPVRIPPISTPLRGAANRIHDIAERSRGQDTGGGTGGATGGFGERSWTYLATRTRTWTRARAGGAREDGGGSCVRVGGEEEE
jgi:hypothetical protein